MNSLKEHKKFLVGHLFWFWICVGRVQRILLLFCFPLERFPIYVDPQAYCREIPREGAVHHLFRKSLGLLDNFLLPVFNDVTFDGSSFLNSEAKSDGFFGCLEGFPEVPFLN